MLNYQRSCFLIILVLSVAYGNHSGEDEFIIGGTPARNVRYQAAIRFRDQVCSGAILNEHWIITSSTCVRRRPEYVRVGSNRYSTGGETYGIEKIIRHSSQAASRANIALLKTNTTMTFSSNVRAINLPTQRLRVNSTLVMTGWGATSADNNRFARILQQLSTMSLSRRECNTRLSTNLPVNEICTFTPNGGMCSGDSGNPLVTRNMLHGVASEFRRPCNSGLPDTITQVFPIREWIENTIANN